MIVFVVILLVAVTWYILWVQHHYKKNKTRPSKLPSLDIDWDVYETGLANGTLKHPLAEKLVQAMGAYVYDGKGFIHNVLIALISGGHILVQGQPGTGKTTLVRTLAQLCALSSSRIQATPDLLPQDVVGTEIFDPQQKAFVVQYGPLVAHIIHVDEINRATPKLQSAFLEAMQEQHISIGTHRITLPTPFFVIATQNPYDSVGTYMLPYAQVDRFMSCVYTSSLSQEEEYKLLASSGNQSLMHQEQNLVPILHQEEIQQMQLDVQSIFADDTILQECVIVMTILRGYGLPLSTRASKSLLAAAKAWAYLQGKHKVEKVDLDAVLASVLRHRVSRLIGHTVQDHTIYNMLTGSAETDDIEV